MQTATFGKAEKLKRQKQIEVLFAEGKSIACFPVRAKYRVLPHAEGAGAGPVQAGVSVSRKNFKRAVDRNRLKRLLREAYRMQKGELLKTILENNKQLHLFLIYTGKTIVSFALVQEAVKSCLAQLQQKVTRSHEDPH
jgi:ribonuclease P protein component